MNRHYYTEIENLRSRLILMSERSTDAFKTSMRGILNESILDCEKAIEMDDEIDFLDHEIERESIKYISLRAPVAGDLRMVLVSIKVASNLERIGDEATSIARRSKKILSEGKIKANLLGIEEMAVITLSMLESTKNMILQPDLDVIKGICDMDREVDALNIENLAGFVEQAKETPSYAKVLFELAFISKVLERIADHVKNIAEQLEHLVNNSIDYGDVSSVAY